MFKKLIYMLLILQATTMSAKSQGFLKRLGEKAASAGSDLLIRKGTQKAEKAIDGNSPGKAKSTNGPVDKKDTKSSKGSASGNLINTYSKFDFIPGEKTLLFDNFDQDAIGEFPLKWYTTGAAEIVKLENQPGKWLQFNSGSFLSPTVKLPDNFTIEFDVFVNLSSNSSKVLPGLQFEIFDRGDKAKRLDHYNYSLKNILYFSTSFHADKAVFSLDSRDNAKQKLKSDKIFLTGFQHNYGSVVHVAISVQKERVRLWYNADKVIDVPTAAAFPANFNQMLFSGPKTAEGYAAFYLTNLRIGAGQPDTRSKLLDQGKFVTNGILFDTNSDNIKPESSGLLKEIAAAMKESASLKFKVIGHTDSDGQAETNLALSKRRAEAVKKALTEEFGVDGSMLSTDGKGAAEPIASNSTSTGKSENRRVEFVKI